MPSKFKPGDRVRYQQHIRDRHPGSKINVFRVLFPHPIANGVYYIVEGATDRFKRDNGSHGWDQDDDLELVPASKFKLDISFDTVDEAIQAAEILSNKLSKPVPILNADE